jgi:hypothetical protein
MIKYRAGLAVLVAGSAFALAACGSSNSGGSPSSSSSPSSAAAAATTSTPAAVTGVNANGPFCTTVKAEQVDIAKLEPTFVAAFETGNFTKIKEIELAFFDHVFADAKQVENSMGSVPANVQAALGVINGFFTQVDDAVKSATSLQDLEAKMITLGKDPSFKAAGEVLAAYGKEQCGTTTPSP